MFWILRDIWVYSIYNNNNKSILINYGMILKKGGEELSVVDRIKMQNVKSERINVEEVKRNINSYYTKEKNPT